MFLPQLYPVITTGMYSVYAEINMMMMMMMMMIVTLHRVVCGAQIELRFPDEGLVYDYRLDDAGITDVDVEDEAEEEIRMRKVSLKPRDLWISH